MLYCSNQARAPSEDPPLGVREGLLGGAHLLLATSDAGGESPLGRSTATATASQEEETVLGVGAAVPGAEGGNRAALGLVAGTGGAVGVELEHVTVSLIADVLGVILAVVARVLGVEVHHLVEGVHVAAGHLESLLVDLTVGDLVSLRNALVHRPQASRTCGNAGRIEMRIGAGHRPLAAGCDRNETGRIAIELLLGEDEEIRLGAGSREVVGLVVGVESDVRGGGEDEESLGLGDETEALALQLNVRGSSLA